MISERGRFGAHLVVDFESKAHIVISVTAIGESLNRKSCTGPGQRPGITFVTGTLAVRPPQLLRMAVQRPLFPEKALQAHLTLNHAARQACGWPGAACAYMMDLSDGLSVDLPRLCDASGLEQKFLRGSSIFRSALWDCDRLNLPCTAVRIRIALPCRAQSRLLENTYPATLRGSRIGMDRRFRVSGCRAK
jgi:hypothetical protein